MNFKTISRNVGYALLVDALFMFIATLIALFGGPDTSFAPLAISFLLTAIVGVFPFIFVRKTPAISLREGYVIIVLSWLLSFLFGMMPYVLWGGPFTVINAWFESVSGFTTTGATILEDIGALPKGLLFWRSSTHFIGGLGVVVFLLLIIPTSSPMRLRLTNMELSSLSKDSYSSRANKTVSIFTTVYLSLNVAAFLCYWLAGMGVFDAVCHAFSVCANGGFSTQPESIGSFHSLPITLITMAFMYLASLHFGMLFMVVAKRSLNPLKNDVFKFFTIGLVAASLAVAFSLKISNTAQTWGQALLDGSFHMFSYASSTGFAISDNSGWPRFASLLLVLMCFCCGMAGSTTGGLKSDRMLLVFKNIRQQVYHAIYPSSIREIRMNGKPLAEGDVAPHIMYFTVFFIILALSIFCCQLFSSADNINCVTGSIASLCNIGPSVGSIGSMGNYNAEASACKFIFSLDMFLGRVEIYPVLSVLYIIFSRRHR
ncbi:MAG: TrkH family potassium uptake protein [Bacteroidales bacterium]|nr:TrkH family potassium uptake protein [Bacteroidales bacterium]